MATKIDLNGVILLDKPYGISSNNLLMRVRYLLRAKKAGHTGALDPLATGMLPICLGESTKIANILLDGNKSYTVTVELGKRTTTSDAEGEVICEKPVEVSFEQVKQTLAQHFSGTIKQQPSIWSALKYQGKPLYEYARKGQDVPRPIRDITIYEIEAFDWEPPFFKITTTVSKGTYIRTLVDDLGELLGCGAYVNQLRRNWVEGFEDQPMVTLEQLETYHENQDQASIDKLILPVDVPAQHLPKITLDDFNAWKLCQGMTCVAPHTELDQLYRVYHQEFGFLGIAIANQPERLRGYRLISTTAEITKILKERIPEERRAPKNPYQRRKKPHHSSQE